MTLVYIGTAFFEVCFLSGIVPGYQIALTQIIVY